MKIANRHLSLEVNPRSGRIAITTIRDAGTPVPQLRNGAILAVRNPVTRRTHHPKMTATSRGSSIVCRTSDPFPVVLTLRLTGNRLRIDMRTSTPPGATLPDRMRAAAALSPLQILPGLFALGAKIVPGSGFTLPLMEGVWIPASTREEFAVLNTHYVMGLSMPFWGACRPGRGSIVGICDHAYLQLLLEGGDKGLRLTPELCADPQAIPAVLEIAFIPGEEPLSAAHEFRRHELAHKHLPSLARRIARVPALAGPAGGANIKFVNYRHSVPRPGTDQSPPRPEKIEAIHRFADVARICRKLKSTGIDRAMAIFWGWGKEGYDRLHPDFLPANPWAGGDAALSRASRAIRSLGFAVGGHDNYQDIYEAAPSFGKGETVAGTPDGQLCKGGFWTGGPCFIQCSKEQLRFAGRNLPEMKKRYGWNSIFVDTTTAAFLYECYHPAHPRSREDDRRDKYDLMRMARARFGVFGSEAGQSWGAEVMDYWEGILLPVPEKRSWWWATKLDGRPLPVFSAVYRDILLAYQHQSQGLHPDLPEFFLASLRSAQPPYYFFDADYYPAHIAYIRKTYEVLAHLHRATLDETVVQHAWLTADRRVEQVTLSGGTIIITNATDTSFEIPPATMPGVLSGHCLKLAPWGFLVCGPDMLAFWAETFDQHVYTPAIWVVARRDARGRVAFFADQAMTRDAKGQVSGFEQIMTAFRRAVACDAPPLRQRRSASGRPTKSSRAHSEKPTRWPSRSAAKALQIERNNNVRNNVS